MTHRSERRERGKTTRAPVCCLLACLLACCRRRCLALCNSSVRGCATGISARTAVARRRDPTDIHRTGITPSSRRYQRHGFGRPKRWRACPPPYVLNVDHSQSALANHHSYLCTYLEYLHTGGWLAGGFGLIARCGERAVCLLLLLHPLFLSFLFSFPVVPQGATYIHSCLGPGDSDRAIGFCCPVPPRMDAADMHSLFFSSSSSSSSSSPPSVFPASYLALLPSLHKKVCGR